MKATRSKLSTQGHINPTIFVVRIDKYYEKSKRTKQYQQKNFRIIRNNPRHLMHTNRTAILKIIPRYESWYDLVL